MEWLSHSQKKYCELCKTPFRFTKLYHPHMPRSLPMAVFLRKGALHLASTLITWIRGLLVISIWLVWLPWSMRFAWWGLFCIADIGWFRDILSVEVVIRNQSQLSSNNTSPNPSFRFKHLHQSLPHSESLSTATDPSQPRTSIATVAQWAFPQIFNFSSISQPANDSLSLAPLPVERNSLLTNISFFKSPTPNAFVNDFIMDVIEGQIITLALVAAFVLILLIREWVVQQQPIINIAAENNDQGEEQDQEYDFEDQEQNDPSLAQTVYDTIANGDVANGAQDAEPLDAGDLTSIEDPALDILIADIFECQEDIKAFCQREMSGTGAAAPDNLVTGSKLIRKLEQTQSAIFEYWKHAVQARDANALETALGKLDRLRMAIRYVPQPRAGRYEADNAELESVTQDLIPLIEGRSIARTLSRSRSRLRSRTPADRARGRSEQPGSRAGSTDRRGNARSRPRMPIRSESFLANEIHRRIQDRQEALSGSQDPSRLRVATESEADHHRESNFLEQLPEATGRLEQRRQSAPIDESGPQPSESSEAQPKPNLDQESQQQPVLEGQGPSEFSQSNQVGSDTSADSPHTPQALPVPNIEVTGDPEEGEVEDENRIAVHEDNEEKGYADRLLDWLWGDLRPAAPMPNQDGPDEHIVQDIHQEAPFIPFLNARPNRQANAAADRDAQPNADDEVVQAQQPAEANVNENDAIEDVEDLEGILELVGMQGPISGLFTNVIFAAVVVAATIATAVWLPFLIGKMALIVLARPIAIFKLPLHVLSLSTNFAIDASILIASGIVNWLLTPISIILPGLFNTESMRNVLESTNTSLFAAASRLFETCRIIVDGSSFDHASYTFDSHSAIHRLHTRNANIAHFFGRIISNIYQEFSDSPRTPAALWNHVTGFSFKAGFAVLYAVDVTANWIFNYTKSIVSDGLTITFEKTAPAPKEQLAPPVWTASERATAIGLGYAMFVIAGAVYFKKFAPITSGRQGKKVEDVVLEILQQAGGILKVILIIGIEMLAFPLYCGFLLDIAMLPLFGNASLPSRLNFTLNSPWTSVFLHWFVGTCYMFHFALFVSMCRKILRRGVLYFIRDPDDPTFHPVRDVLERNVTSQLRKIGSSAMIYGGLILVCLGSVVWMLAYGIGGVLPVRWGNSSGILGFPVDLLLYTTLKPVILRVLTPTDGLSKVYDWWFRICARALDLSDFLFGDERDEEESNQKVSKSKGRLMRVPASDQVRIPKGRQAFFEIEDTPIKSAGEVTAEDQTSPVGEENAGDDQAGEDIQPGSTRDPDYTNVYIPNWFRIRIGIFVVCLWFLTAGAGFSLAVLPLLIGRVSFGIILPGDLWANDIYAFSVGTCLIGGTVWLITKYREADQAFKAQPDETWRKLAEFVRTLQTPTSQYFFGACRIAFTYAGFAVYIPGLFSLLVDLYFIGPLHVYLGDRTHFHIVHILQNWTLGLQYVRIFVHFLHWHSDSRPARAFRAIIEPGYLNPNAKLAARYFLLPITLLASIAVIVPASVGWAAARAICDPSDEIRRTQLQRLAYPIVLVVCYALWRMYRLAQSFREWRLRIRDEAYLIGERLHNFGEKRPSGGLMEHSVSRRVGHA